MCTVSYNYKHSMTFLFVFMLVIGLLLNYFTSKREDLCFPWNIEPKAKLMGEGLIGIWDLRVAKLRAKWKVWE